MTDAGNIKAVEALGVDLIGFIFYPHSPRCIREVPAYLPRQAAKVGVFVDAPIDMIIAEDKLFHFDYIQLHGCENSEYCLRLKDLGFKIVKAFSISREDVRLSVAGYEGICDMFLFDTRCPGLAGGSGQTFDWNIISSYEEKTPFLLSGGIGPETAGRLRAFSHPLLAGYDLNSRFETAPGMKDVAAIKKFIDTLATATI